MIVLATLGAADRRLLGRRGRKPVHVDSAEEPAPLPVARATLIDAEPVADPERWLETMRRDPDAYVDDALRELNAVLRAHRAAAANPYIREVGRAVANAVRIGYGSGDQVADGRFSDAYELPATPLRARPAEAMAPLERLAAVLNGTEEVGVAEELVLRARLDVEAGRLREAALQARIALEAMLAEGGSAELSAFRGPIGDAANRALEGELSEELKTAVVDAVREMRRALHRASGRG